MFGFQNSFISFFDACLPSHNNGNRFVFQTKEQFSVEGAALAVFEIENEKLVDTGNIHPVPEIVSALAFTPDGTRLLVAAQKKLLTYEMVDDFSVSLM